MMFYLVAAVILSAVIAWIMMPSPVEVDLQRSQKGTLMVTVDEEGETRAKDRFVVSCPVSGRLTRILFKEGDPVGLNQSVAIIHPLPLGKRESTEIRARLQAAEALSREAEILIRQTQLNLEKVPPREAADRSIEQKRFGHPAGIGIGPGCGKIAK